MCGAGQVHYTRLLPIKVQKVMILLLKYVNNLNSFKMIYSSLLYRQVSTNVKHDFDLQVNYPPPPLTVVIFHLMLLSKKNFSLIQKL